MRPVDPPYIVVPEIRRNLTLSIWSYAAQQLDVKSTLRSDLRNFEV